jgi:glutamate-ammonia-ligase adenylyltransferase
MLAFSPLASPEPSPPADRSALEQACPDVEAATLDDFLGRLDPDYFRHFAPGQICRHMRMAQSLDEQRPFALEVRRDDPRRMGITVVAFDYFAEFSVLCGLVASFGLDILSGYSYTFSSAQPGAPPPGPARLRRRQLLVASRAKIVDVFEVRVAPGERFDWTAQSRLVEELDALESLLAAGELQRLRERLDQRIIERLARSEAAAGADPDPQQVTEVRFRDGVSDRWTVMDVDSRDTPGFLYAFTNALAIRGVYIHRAHIESVGERVRDRFFISDRRGRRIDGEAERAVLARAVTLIEQFSRFLPRAPDPARAVRYFDQFLDKVLERDPEASSLRIVTRREGLDLLARLLGSSEFLWEEVLRNNFESLGPVFERLGADGARRGRRELSADLAERLGQCDGDDSRRRALNDFKDGEMLLLVLQQMSSPRSLARFSAGLTELAEVVLEHAVGIAAARLEAVHGRPRRAGGGECALAVCALGKLGGQEIGYASDAELVFVYEGSGGTEGASPIPAERFFELLVRGVVDLIEARREGAFRIDLRLRPHGKAGPMASPFPAWCDYYREEGDAAPFERQALTKLRVIAGDAGLAGRILEHRDRFVYSGAAWDMARALHLRGRQLRELTEPGSVNLKYSAGGLIDVEYAVQYLQLTHGAEHPELRTPNTLEGLRALQRAGFLEERAQRRLAAGYTFLRRLIDAMRMVKDDASDIVLPPVESREYGYLARRMGYRDREWKRAAERLSGDVARQMGTIEASFTERFGSYRG